MSFTHTSAFQLGLLSAQLIFLYVLVNLKDTIQQSQWVMQHFLLIDLLLQDPIENLSPVSEHQRRWVGRRSLFGREHEVKLEAEVW